MKNLLTVADADVSVLAGSMYRILLDSACAPLTISIVSSDFFWSDRYSTFFLLLEHIRTHCMPVLTRAALRLVRARVLCQMRAPYRRITI